jgi:DNA polymerase-4
MDMDAFYASVEQVDHPELRGKPVIVGGRSHRGVVSAASYEARKFGVRSAMPIFEAEKRCPQGTFLTVRMGRYKAVSTEIMAILEAFSPLVEQVSIDEAYMDVSGADRLYASPRALALRLKEEIRRETALTCSIGIAPNRFLAKIASDRNKPDGLTIIEPEEVQAVIDKLPIQKVPGVGRKTAQSLKRLGISRLGDMRALPESVLSKAIGKFGARLLDFSKGVDASPVVPYTEAKSISSEETLPRDTGNPATLKKVLLTQAEAVGRSLRRKQLRGGTVTLKVKHSDFTLVTRSMTLDEPTDCSNTLYECGVRLLEELDTWRRVRLVGVGVSKLVGGQGAGRQLNLFDGSVKEKSWGDVEKAVDTIKERFGDGAIKRGGFL